MSRQDLAEPTDLIGHRPYSVRLLNEYPYITKGMLYTIYKMRFRSSSSLATVMFEKSRAASTKGKCRFVAWCREAAAQEIEWREEHAET